MSMKTLWLSGLLAIAAIMAAPALAASTAMAMPPICPFTQQGLAALSLTPEQASSARHIAWDFERGLLVQSPVLANWPELRLGMPHDYGAVPLDRLIADNRAHLAELLGHENASPTEIRRLARETAVQELTLREVVNAGTIALRGILTPAQQDKIPDCPRISMAMR